MNSTKQRPVGDSPPHRPLGGQGRRPGGSNHPLLPGGSQIGRLGGSSSAASESIATAANRNIVIATNVAFRRFELGFPWQGP